MTEHLTTRGPFQDNGVTVKWMLESGKRTLLRTMPAVERIRNGIQLRTPGPDGRVLETHLDAGEAADLYIALEAHMENIAMRVHHPDGTVTKDFRKSNLEAIQKEIDTPLFPTSGVRSPACLEAVERVMDAWTNPGDFEGYHSEAKSKLRNTWPSLASALDRLASLPR